MAEAETKTESILKRKQKDNVIQKDLRSADIVRYYRKDIKSKEAWRGPAKIIAVDGASVIIDHAGKIVNAHVKDVRKFRNELKHENPWHEDELKKENLMMKTDAENDTKLKNVIFFCQKSGGHRTKEQSSRTFAKFRMSNRK